MGSKRFILRNIALGSVFVILFLLVSCGQEEAPYEEITKDIDLENKSLLKNKSFVENNTTEVILPLPADGCTPHWDCLSSKFKAYQLENCSWTDKKECPLGCYNGTCRVSTETCKRGWNCKGKYIRGFQLEACDWIQETKCEWGCENAECKPEPNETTTVESSSEEPQAAEPLPILKAGEIKVISGHNVSIYLIEEDQVKIQIDGKKSDWLEQGNSFTSSGLTITIQEIYYQAYGGGKQEITYNTG